MNFAEGQQKAFMVGRLMLSSLMFICLVVCT